MQATKQINASVVNNNEVMQAEEIDLPFTNAKENVHQNVVLTGELEKNCEDEALSKEKPHVVEQIVEVQKPEKSESQQESTCNVNEDQSVRCIFPENRNIVLNNNDKVSS